MCFWCVIVACCCCCWWFLVLFSAAMACFISHSIGQTAQLVTTPVTPSVAVCCALHAGVSAELHQRGMRIVRSLGGTVAETQDDVTVTHLVAQEGKGSAHRSNGAGCHVPAGRGCRSWGLSRVQWPGSDLHHMLPVDLTCYLMELSAQGLYSSFIVLPGLVKPAGFSCRGRDSK